MEKVCENTVSLDFKQARSSSFVPVIRSGDWSDIGGRDYMEDAHVCISDLANNFGHNSVDDEIISFYGVTSCFYSLYFDSSVPI
jgi:protein phosphatase 2C family protein 2/3